MTSERRVSGQRAFLSNKAWESRREGGRGRQLGGLAAGAWQAQERFFPKIQFGFLEFFLSLIRPRRN